MYEEQERKKKELRQENGFLNIHLFVYGISKCLV